MCKRWDTPEKIHNALFRECRIEAGRNPGPSVGIIDSQSVKITERGGEHGYDSGKKVNGRKRHIITDVPGLIICVTVHSADIQDRDGAKLLLPCLSDRISRFRLIRADGGYTGYLIGRVREQSERISETVSRPAETEGFFLLPRRRAVERTFARLNQHRRLSKDYEYLTDTGEVMIEIAMIGIMLRRLAPQDD